MGALFSSAFLSLEYEGAFNVIISKYVDIGGSVIHYLSREEEKSNGLLLVLLHGFPENAHTWEALISLLPTSVDVIAPDLPGYHLSSPLADESDYQVPFLISRMATFIGKVKGDRDVILLGHDWGGAIAWPLAAFHHDLIKKLIIINAAHPSTFTQSLKTSQRQREKSQYIHDLIDKNAQQWLVDTNFELLKVMLGQSLDEESEAYGKGLINDWSAPKTLNAMLNYYKQMPQQVPQINATESELDSIRVPDVFIHLPVLVLWGERDDAFDLSVLDNIEHYVPSIDIHFHKDASHWLHRDEPQWVFKKVTNFIAA